jgi:hypothetical protein
MRNASLGVSSFAPSPPPAVTCDVVDEEDDDGSGEWSGGRLASTKCRARVHLTPELGLLGMCSVRGARLVQGSACKLVFEVLGYEDGHLNEEKITRDRARLCIVQNGSHRHLNNTERGH